MPPGYRRSRALWDEARRPNAPRSALVRAILYELQPVRFSAIDVSGILGRMRSIGSGLVVVLTETLPSILRTSFRVLRSMTVKHWLIVGGIFAYYYLVKYVHRVLDAGPMLIIVTALVAIFTVGLGDGDNQGVSAYSVFNRGFERILGSLDEDALVQQHVGGAMGFAVGMGAAPEVEHDNARPAVGLQRVREQDDEPQDNVARAPPPQDDEENDENDNPVRERSRKSGKKARRNLEQRRELQRQRQAAMAMGFEGDEGQEEMVALQRLLEEEIAANNNRR